METIAEQKVTQIVEGLDLNKILKSLRKNGTPATLFVTPEMENQLAEIHDRVVSPVTPPSTADVYWLWTTLNKSFQDIHALEAKNHELTRLYLKASLLRPRLA